MTISKRQAAEERFGEIQKKCRQALTETEMEQRDRAERTARLRALRLANEATGSKGRYGHDGGQDIRVRKPKRDR